MPIMDPTELEQMLRAAIRDRFMAVAIVAQYCKVELRERFPDSDKKDIAISTVPDLVNANIPMTSIIQIGLPRVSERPYTSEQATQIDFEYPITYDLSVKDEWASNATPYGHSSALAMAVYMYSRAEFARDKTLAVFENCEHDYLQQENAASVEDEETGSYIHTLDWSLMVHVKGIVTG